MLPIQQGVNEAYLPPRARVRNLVVDGPLHQKQTPDMIAARAPYLVLSSRPDIDANPRRNTGVRRDERHSRA